MTADEATRRFRRRVASGHREPLSAELTAEAKKLGKMISDLFAETHSDSRRVTRRVKEIRAGADVRDTRKRRTTRNTPTMSCAKCGEKLQGDNLAVVYDDHQQLCPGGREETS